jgi:hypothetical protein
MKFFNCYFSLLFIVVILVSRGVFGMNPQENLSSSIFRRLRQLSANRGAFLGEISRHITVRWKAFASFFSHAPNIQNRKRTFS